MAVLQFSTFTRLRKSRSLWALADQGVVSAGSFVTSLMLMRTYDKATFGVYALLISIIALMNTLHTSVITYPLSVRGAAAPDEQLRNMSASSLVMTTLLSLPLQIGILIATVLLHGLILYPAVALAMIAWQWQETTRRALMAHLRNAETVWGDAVSYLGQAIAVIWLCHNGHVPTLRSVFYVVAATSFAAATLQAIQLRIPIRNKPKIAALAGDYWHLGRWLLMTNGLNFLTIQLITWTLYKFQGSDVVGVFAALGSVLGVSHPIMFGISGLIVPGAAKARAEQGMAAARRYAIKLSAIGGSLLLPYFIFLLIYPHLALRIFSGAHSPYLHYTTELRWFVLQYVAVYLSVVTTALLNGIEAPRWTFMGQAANAVVSTLFRVPIAAMAGLGAAVWSGIFTYGIHVVVNAIGLRASARSHVKSNFPPLEQVPELALEV